MRSCRPPTPPPMGQDKFVWRFKSMTTPCESIEDYQPGGYHPVHLGDVFHEGRYKVIRKLGEGGFSTVWLAHDMQGKGYVALKIMIAKARPTTELLILRHIQDVVPAEGGKHITRMLSEFEHHGPNGTHRCLVFEPMGPNVNVMKEELPQFTPRKKNMKVRYPPTMAKRILRHALESIEFLHSQGISHGDLQPGNMLFALNNINAVPEEELRQPENDDEWDGTISEPVERRDGKKDLWAPRYLCIAQSLAPFTTHDENHLQIKLSDVGGAFFWDRPPNDIVTPLGLSPPEHVFDKAIHKSLDIWSFGCLLFELLAGFPLFLIWGGDFQEDDLILSFCKAIGPLPDDMFQRWENSHLYFNEERELFNTQLGGPHEEDGPLPPSDRQLMEKQFDDAGVEISTEEATMVKRLIRRILQYGPEKRPSATEILQDPWFQEIEAAEDIVAGEDVSGQQDSEYEQDSNLSAGPEVGEKKKDKVVEAEESEKPDFSEEAGQKDHSEGVARETSLAQGKTLVPEVAAPDGNSLP